MEKKKEKVRRETRGDFSCSDSLFVSWKVFNSGNRFDFHL